MTRPFLMFQTVPIPVSDLLLDPKNARLGEELPSQQAIYHALAQQQGRRFINLADDVVRFGLDPTTLLAVVATSDRRKRYKVLEGNRRVLALKALDTPSIVFSAFLAAADQRRLNELAAKYALNPRDPVDCVLFDTEEEAAHWIELRHTGANEGVGLAEWDANEKDRYRARHGVRKPAGQILDFLDKVLPSSQGPVANPKVMTSITRLIGTPAVRESLGIAFVEGQVVSQYPTAEVVKGLSKMVGDLKSGKVRVGDIYHEENRLDYIKSFSRKDLPVKSKAFKDGPVNLEDLAAGNVTPVATAPKKPRKSKAATARTTLIPSTCSINPSHPRISAIYNELLNINADQYPNACAVLLRVFLELSIDDEIDRSKLMTEQQRSAAKLSNRLRVVAKHLASSGRINNQLMKAIDKIANSQVVIAASTMTFNQYVHNPYVLPKPSELRIAWDELQPFMEKLWP